MNAKEILLHQMAACHDEENWFVPMIKALEGLSADQAGWHDDSSNNSIWQNVNHLVFWNGRWLLKFNGVVPEKFVGDNDDTFKGEKENGSEEDWNSSKDKLFTVLAGWRAALGDADENKLTAEYSPGATWYELISDIATHNAYHLGQIIHTRKLQGSWIPKQWQISAPPSK
jgi:uncharacterized damage-inducible protein DinB